MKLLYKGILTYGLSFFIISTIVIQVINIVQFEKNICFTLNYGLLWFQGNNTLVYDIAMISTIPCVVLLFNCFMPSSSKNKANYNKLMTKSEAKRDLLRVHFNKNGIYYSVVDKVEIFFSKQTRRINKMIMNSKDSNAIANYLFRNDIKLPSVKQFEINGEIKYKRAGFPIVTNTGTVWLDASDSHNMVIGTTNSGKTYSILFEMIESCRIAGESAIIVDLKGELSKVTYHKFQEDGYDCYCIDFIEPSLSQSWNPLELGKIEYFKEKERLEMYKAEMQEKIDRLKAIHKAKYGDSIPFVLNEKNENGDDILDKNGDIKLYPNYSKAEEYFADVSNVIYASDTNGDDSHWYNSASELCTGLIFFLAELGIPEYLNLEAVKKLCDLGDMEYSKKKTYLQVAIEKLKKPDDISTSKLIGYTDVAENTRKSIKSVFSTRLSKIIMNQDVKNMMASNSIDLTKIGDRKTVIFLKVHDEKSIYYPLVNLFMSQVYETLIENARNNANLKLKVPLNILWDEFGSSPKFEPIMNLLSAGRSRGIRVTMVVQGYDQLESKYGKDGARSIKNNVMNKVYLLSGDEETLKEFSDLAGKKQVFRNGKYEEEPLFSIERLSKFKLGEALFIRQRKNPFYTKLLPYNKYKFYSDEETVFTNKPRPVAKWFDIKKYVEENVPRIDFTIMKK